MVQRVRFGDLDAMQHMNNVEFLRFFETARIEYIADAARPSTRPPRAASSASSSPSATSPTARRPSSTTRSAPHLAGEMRRSSAARSTSRCASRRDDRLVAEATARSSATTTPRAAAAAARRGARTARAGAAPTRSDRLPADARSKYDCIVIGSGPGGYVAAIRAAQLGMKTAVVEKDARRRALPQLRVHPRQGGAARGGRLGEVGHAGDFGIKVEGAEVDFTGVGAHRDKVIKTLTGGVGMLFKKNKIDVIEGHGSVTDDGNVKVGGQFDGTRSRPARWSSPPGSVAKPLLGLEFGGRVLDTAAAWLLRRAAEAARGGRRRRVGHRGRRRRSAGSAPRSCCSRRCRRSCRSRTRTSPAPARARSASRA